MLTEVTIFLFILGSANGLFYERRSHCRFLMNGRCLHRMSFNSQRAPKLITGQRAFKTRPHVRNLPFSTRRTLNKNSPFQKTPMNIHRAFETRLHLHDAPFNNHRTLKTILSLHGKPMHAHRDFETNLNVHDMPLNNHRTLDTKLPFHGMPMDIQRAFEAIPLAHNPFETSLHVHNMQFNNQRASRRSFPQCRGTWHYSNNWFNEVLKGRYFKNCKGETSEIDLSAYRGCLPRCHRNLEYVLSNDCTKMWRCKNRLPVRVSRCKPGLIFSKKLLVCTQIGGHFDDCRETGEVTTRKPRPVATTIPHYPICRSQFETIINEDCSQLWRCRWGTPMRMPSCRRGKIFSRKLRKCVKKGGRYDDCQKKETTTVISSPSTTVATAYFSTRPLPSTTKLQSRVTTRSPRPTSPTQTTRSPRLTSSTQNPEHNTVISTSELINYTADTSQEDRRDTSASNTYENVTVSIIQNTNDLSTDDTWETTTATGITTSLEQEEFTSPTDNYTTRQQNLSTNRPTSTTVSGLCRVDQFQCDDGSCIPIKYKCDDYKDCPDAADEDFELCSRLRTCLEGEYLCDDGTCVRGIECNGVDECSDGSDESELKCR